MPAPIPANEPARLDALRRYRVLNTPSEQAFEELCVLAAHICVVPIATIAFLDADKLWYKSKLGLTMTGRPRDISFAAHAIGQMDIFTVEDALKDDRFSKLPDVVAYPYIRFYSSVTLMTADGFAIGTLEVMDRNPRKLRPEQEDALRALARQVITQLELRRSLMEMEGVIAERTRSEQILRDSERKFRDLVESAPDAIVIADRSGLMQLVNARMETVFGYSREELIGKPIEMLIPDQYRGGHVHHRDSYFEAPRRRPMGASQNITGRRKDGSIIRVEISLSPMKTADGVQVIAFVRDLADQVEKAGNEERGKG